MAMMNVDETLLNRYNRRMEMEIQKEIVRVRVPATSANLGPGFDSLGIALQLYSYVSVGESITNENCIHMQGEGSEYCDIAIEDNIAWQAIEKLARRLNITLPPLLLNLENSIPLARGLGSSAAVRVGALVALNLWLKRTGKKFLSEQELLDLATELEGHPDNVASALLGGMTASVWDGEKVFSSPVIAQEWPQFIVFIPKTELETKAARSVLPQSVSRQDAIYNVSRLGLLIASLSSGNWRENPQLLKVALQDCLHQPYRAPLILAFDEVQNAALEKGALGVTLSGAGPSILVWLKSEANYAFKAQLKSAISQAAVKKGVSGKVIELEIDTEGCVVTDAQNFLR